MGPDASETLRHCCQDGWGKDNPAGCVHPRERITVRQGRSRGLHGGPHHSGLLGTGGHATEQSRPVWASTRQQISVRKSISNSRRKTKSSNKNRSLLSLILFNLLILVNGLANHFLHRSRKAEAWES